ncbi:MAG TPA: hypothetical protein VFE34_15500 [Dongiaceae bacterium]|nr:hypothetical protein [Dongiaceae bacterium]
MTGEEPKYDVAISFLYKDLGKASALYQRLSERLEVFFYPRKQEELSGTDGMVTMREPFFRGSRLVVVLYDEPWGQTPWTRIEQTAIQERCLQDGWDGLYFITVGRPKKLPPWMPSQLVRFSLEDFPIEQAVGAIKARVQELGSKVSPMTPAKAAAQHAAEVQYEKDRQNFFITPSSPHKAQDEARKLFAAVVRLCEEAKDIHGVDLVCGAVDKHCVVTNGHVSMSIDWEPVYSNTLTDSQLVVRFHDQRIALPSQSPFHYFEPPRRANLAHYKPELARDRTFCWSFDEKQYTSEQVASDALMSFLDQATRAVRRQGRQG